MDVYPVMLASAQTHTHAHKHTHARKHARTHARTHAGTCMHTHTDKHTHTHAICRPLQLHISVECIGSTWILYDSLSLSRLSVHSLPLPLPLSLSLCSLSPSLSLFSLFSLSLSWSHVSVKAYPGFPGPKHLSWDRILMTKENKVWLKGYYYRGFKGFPELRETLVVIISLLTQQFYWNRT